MVRSPPPPNSRDTFPPPFANSQSLTSGFQRAAQHAKKNAHKSRQHRQPQKLREKQTSSGGRKWGGQIVRGRIWRFWGAPIFSPEVPKYPF